MAGILWGSSRNPICVLVYGLGMGKTKKAATKFVTAFCYVAGPGYDPGTSGL